MHTANPVAITVRANTTENLNVAAINTASTNKTATVKVARRPRLSLSWYSHPESGVLTARWELSEPGDA